MPPSHKVIGIDFEAVSEAYLFDDAASRLTTGQLVVRTYNPKTREWKSEPISGAVHFWNELDRELEGLERDIRIARERGRAFLRKP